MPCLVCGAPKTVRSHLLPKALIKEIREDAKHVVSDSRHRKGVRLSQGGSFDRHLLCAEHENATADLDRYGTEFLRRSETVFETLKPDRTFEVINPQPDTLRNFALSVVWGEVDCANGALSRLSLGPYEDRVRSAVFDRAELQWPLLVSRTQFSVEKRGAVKFALHPFRVRFSGLSAWSFTAVGHAFWLISDRRGLPATHDFVRADLKDPATVIVGHQQDFGSVGILQKLFANMRQR